MDRSKMLEKLVDIRENYRQLGDRGQKEAF